MCAHTHSTDKKCLQAYKHTSATSMSGHLGHLTSVIDFFLQYGNLIVKNNKNAYKLRLLIIQPS